MSTGSCFCGKVAIEFSGEPAKHALCHCGDCRKIGGGSYSNNLVVPNENFKVTAGTPKEYTKTADSGKKITSFFCGDCGSTLFRRGESAGPMAIIKLGVLDGRKYHDKAPAAELYAPDRAKFIPEVKDAAQLTAMGS